MPRRDSLEISERADGVRFPVIVAPRSSKTGVAGVHDGALKVRLSSPPVEGAANNELIAFFAKKLRVPKSAVTIVSGKSSKRKNVTIAGVGGVDVEAAFLKQADRPI